MARIEINPFVAVVSLICTVFYETANTGITTSHCSYSLYYGRSDVSMISVVILSDHAGLIKCLLY